MNKKLKNKIFKSLYWSAITVNKKTYILTEHTGSEGLSGSANLSDLLTCRFMELMIQKKKKKIK
jgi:hypothetical protein